MSQGSANQPVLLFDANGVAIVFGQATMANSLPVVIVSNQSALPVEGREIGRAHV